MILHGAGSAKESHFDFARGCRADGIAALAFDARGHGRSEGAFGPGAIEDALAMGGLLREARGAGRAARLEHGRLRGDPRGARASRAAGAVVAICPAPEELLLRGLRSASRCAFDCDVPATEPWLEALDIYEARRPARPADGAAAAARARATSRSPTRSARSCTPRRTSPSACWCCPGGHHRSLQHDLELQAVSRRFILAAAGS